MSACVLVASRTRVATQSSAPSSVRGSSHVIHAGLWGAPASYPMIDGLDIRRRNSGVSVDSKVVEGRDGYLDGWRGIAIAFVLVGHFVPVPGINLGRLGVELFFALSGSLIGQILFIRQEALDSFAAKRFARIVPSMWLFCAVAVVIEYGRSGAMSFDQLYAVLGLGNYVRSSVRLDHLWSVGLELQGYLALGLVAWVARGFGLRPHWVVAAVIMLSWLLVAMRVLSGADEYFSTYWRFEYRLTAMLAAAAFMSMGVERLRSLPSWWWACGLGVALQIDNVPDALKYTLGSLLIALGCVQLRNAKPPAILQLRALRYLGGISFSVYLWQQLFYAETSVLGYKPGLVAALVLGFAAYRLWDDRIHHAVRNWLLRGAQLGGLSRPRGSPPN